VRVRLQPRNRDGTHGTFEAERLADGLRLWLQLALLAGVESVERMASALGDIADSEYEIVNLTGKPQDVETERFDAALQAIRSLGPDASAEWPPELASPVRFVRTPGRIVLADEPEQHLNPRLQRRAARWLAE